MRGGRRGAHRPRSAASSPSCGGSVPTRVFPCIYLREGSSRRHRRPQTTQPHTPGPACDGHVSGSARKHAARVVRTGIEGSAARPAAQVSGRAACCCSGTCTAARKQRRRARDQSQPVSGGSHFEHSTGKASWAAGAQMLQRGHPGHVWADSTSQQIVVESPASRKLSVSDASPKLTMLRAA